MVDESYPIIYIHFEINISGSESFLPEITSDYNKDYGHNLTCYGTVKAKLFQHLMFNNSALKPKITKTFDQSQFQAR